MSGILDTVNQRTQLVGQNRLELLTFRLMRKQRYGINVFKVKEVLQCPKLTSMPNLHPLVKGVAHIRGQTISVIDMSLATGGLPITDPENRFIIISEFNRSTQGFLVGSVERIVNMHWEAILPPPEGTGSSNYLTAVTEIEGELVEILDVEKILNQISPVNEEISEELLANKPVFEEGGSEPTTVLVADDSSVARRQVKRAVESIGYNVLLAHDGRDALEKLQGMTADGTISDLALVISDIEMPEMDGYTLTTEIKKDANLKDLHVVLHSSLSGVFNEAMVKRVGADAFIAKFDPDELGAAVMSAVKGQED
ncbi:chemotaxis protein CheV [Grimontia hollisae]|uniref:Chemotaxis protein CheV n=2 Tax=Grimontia hollisae TaxID=673 RepID=D0ICC8_GRIHO|nr:chemotaxis protein CheV [Grimontia hollisae]AMG29920.1 chemotaxis protein CheV [Grimontia hollisae]EEY71546.1 chemotaxis protein CheV [Grimontia hollisae CIP 101886]MDF2185585.1 chemotaxis protein CheV [Grimontia hollisae]STO43056.1 Chemotaxis protein CheV [Grimontia hollisae]STO56778.1 Chemotaxis protein CheV [Grimontia hollisae]